MAEFRHALGDERGFVHKRILGGLKGAVGGILGGPGGIVGGAIGGFVGGGRRPPTTLPVPFQRFLPPPIPARTTFVQGGCPPGFVMTGAGCQSGGAQAIGFDPLGLAQGTLAEQVGSAFITNGGEVQQRPGVPLGREGQLLPIGEAVMGRFGAGFKPAVFSQQARRCGRGAVLGLDGICYNKRDISNKERFWPRGRRPLLTGGEMRCISIASRAAGKLQKKQKQLQKLGLLKVPSARKAAQPKGRDLGTVPRVLQIQQE